MRRAKGRVVSKVTRKAAKQTARQLWIVIPDGFSPFFFFFLSSGLLRLISLVALMGSMIVPIRVETRGLVSWLTAVPVFQCFPTGFRMLRSNCTWLPYGCGTAETCRKQTTGTYLHSKLTLYRGNTSLGYSYPCMAFHWNSTALVYNLAKSSGISIGKSTFYYSKHCNTPQIYE